VDEGDPVAAGDVLVRLDTSEVVVARLDGLAADLDQARAQREAEKPTATRWVAPLTTGPKR